MNINNKKFSVKKNTIISNSDKNYNPFKALLEFYQGMSSGDGAISDFKASYQQSLDQKKSKYVSEAVKRKASEIGYSDDDLEKKYDEIYEKIKSQYPNIWMQKSTFMEQASSGFKAFGKTGLKTVSKIMKIGGQAISEKIYSAADSIPGFGNKASKLLENIGFDKKKIKPKPVALFSATGEINKEAFYDENREGFTDFAKDVLFSKPAGILFKTFGSGAIGGIFIAILGPIGLIPAIGIQVMGFKSTFESIAIEIPEKLFMLISTTALNGFKNSDKIPESIQIEFEDKEIFIKDQNGIIIGSSIMTPEEKEVANQFVQDLALVNNQVNEINEEIIKNQKKQHNDNQFESVLSKFANAYKNASEETKNKNTKNPEDNNIKSNPSISSKGNSSLVDYFENTVKNQNKLPQSFIDKLNEENKKIPKLPGKSI